MDLALAGDRCSFRVAFAAYVGDALRGHIGVGSAGTGDVVVTVAVDAAGRELISQGDRLTVERFRMLTSFIRVTGTAIHFCNRPVVRELFPGKSC